MPHDGDGNSADGLSKSEAMIERIIASLKWLAEACRSAGLANYADILDEAFTKCLQHYVIEQRDKLADSLESSADQPSRKLN